MILTFYTRIRNEQIIEHSPFNVSTREKLPVMIKNDLANVISGIATSMQLLFDALQRQCLQK